MKNNLNNNSLDNSNAFLDSTFTNLDPNNDIKKLYKLIDDNNLKYNFEMQMDLTNLRNENYKRYRKINISKYKGLPNDFSSVANEILEFYSLINVKNILSDDYENSKNNKIVLDNIYRRISRLNHMVKSYLKELTISNDEYQKNFSRAYFVNLQIDDGLKKILIEKYNDLVLYSSSISDDIYEELKIQLQRKEYIDDILKQLNYQQTSKINTDSNKALEEINYLINQEISEYTNKINYLADLMPENSKYTNEFDDFKEFLNKLFSYDDTDYENARQTLEILVNDDRLKKYITSLEELFVEEREYIKDEKTFVYEKIGIKNFKDSIEYILSNYYSSLNDENINIIEYIINKLNDDNCDLEELHKALNLVVSSIWKNQITNVYSFNPNEDYYFICSNNQFIDEKYQTILITKKEIDKFDDYEDYQIGFVCGYNNNILYITENNDIMTINHDDMANLKTPLQLEREFINFKSCNRIALDGYKTEIEAVYYINDGNINKYLKAISLANEHNLPLLEFKKDNLN